MRRVVSGRRRGVAAVAAVLLAALLPVGGAGATAGAAPAATVVWTGAGDAVRWQDPANWSTRAVPGPLDVVSVPDVAGTHGVLSETDVVVAALDTAESLRLTGGALRVGPVDGLRASADVVLDGGGIAGTTVVTRDGAVLTAVPRRGLPVESPNVLTGVTLHGDLRLGGIFPDLPAAVVARGGLTLDGSAELGFTGALVLAGTQTLRGPATLKGGGGRVLLPDPAATVTLAADVRVSARVLVIGPSGSCARGLPGCKDTPSSTLVVEGDVEALEEQPSSSGLEQPALFQYPRLALVPDRLVFRGRGRAAPRGALVLGGAWTNTGQLRSEREGTVVLGGAYRPQDLGDYRNDGGLTLLAGDVDASTAPLLTGAATGRTCLGNHGRVHGGSLGTAPGTTLTVVSGTLEDTVLTGTARVGECPGFGTAPPPSDSIDGLRLPRGLRVDGELSVRRPVVLGPGRQVLSGGGTLRLDGGELRSEPGGTTVLASGLRVRGAGLLGGSAYTDRDGAHPAPTVENHTTVVLDEPSGSSRVLRLAGDGTVEVRGRGRAYVTVAGGTPRAVVGEGSSLVLGGAVTPEQLGRVRSERGEVVVAGALRSSATLDVRSLSGVTLRQEVSVEPNYPVLAGAAVLASEAAPLRVDQGVLSSVRVTGPVVLGPDAPGYLGQPPVTVLALEGASRVDGPLRVPPAAVVVVPRGTGRLDGRVRIEGRGGVLAVGQGGTLALGPQSALTGSLRDCTQTICPQYAGGVGTLATAGLVAPAPAGMALAFARVDATGTVDLRGGALRVRSGGLTSTGALFAATGRASGAQDLRLRGRTRITVRDSATPALTATRALELRGPLTVELPAGANPRTGRRYPLVRSSSTTGTPSSVSVIAPGGVRARVVRVTTGLDLVVDRA